jgi:hypothetical protein
LSKKQIDPKNYDYNKDTYITASDWDLGKKDANKDGTVTPQEERKYAKAQQTTTTTTTTKGGETSSKTQTPPVEEPPPNWSRQQASAAGFTREFLRRNPDIIPLLKKAIENNWTQDEFNSIIKKDTKWGQSTTESERKFDLAYYGEDPTTIKKTLETNKQTIQRFASNAGITLSDADLQDFAYKYTRSALTEQDIYEYVASKYGVTPATPAGPDGLLPGMGIFLPTGPTGPTGATGPAGTTGPTVGTASILSDSIRAMARSYGITLTPDTLTAKVKEGLAQGTNWQTWLEGQRNVYRQNAKTMYPPAADRLDEYTLEELLNPYLEDASNMLGIRRENMDITNPMWTTALSNPDGKGMTRDQWLVTLRTDKQYGWSKTLNAKREASDLVSGITRAFGMA